MAIQRHSLMLELRVSKLLPAPQTAAVGIGLFRVPCPYVQAHPVTDQTLTLVNGSTLTLDRPFGVLVLRTNRALSVKFTSKGVESSVAVSQLLVLDCPLEKVTLTYSDPLAAEDSYASISLIQA